MMRAAAAVLAAVTALTAAGSAVGTARQLRIAYITNFAAAADPHDLRGVALLGFQRAVKDFNVVGRVVQFDPNQGAEPTLTLLARQRYDLIFVGELRAVLDVDVVNAVARRFPSSKFVITDPPVFTRWAENVQGSIWRVEQPSYLAGFLAGAMERRRPGRHVVGSVGGLPIVPVNTFIAGFEAGTKHADPGITVLRKYAYNFFNTAKCRTVALSEIAAGAGVLFNVAGVCGLGTLRAAHQRHVWAIGVDVDQSFLGPQVLTSVLKRFDVQVHDTVQALVQGRLRTGGNAVWDLRNGAVGLGRISPRVPGSILRQVARVREQIAAGTITIPTSLAR
jgi:basic membrane protein A and related proteins